VTVGAFLAALATPALAGGAIPLTGTPLPLGLGITSSESPTAVLAALLGFLGDRPELLVALAVLIAATLALPRAGQLGAWGAALWGSGVLTLLVLTPSLAGFQAIDAFPLVVGVWAAAAVLVARGAKASR
jgi:hypothetical protein